MYSDSPQQSGPNAHDPASDPETPGVSVRVRSATAIVISGWLTAALVMLLLSDSDAGRQTTERFGNAVATELAALSARPLMTSDAIALGAQTRRLIAGGSVTQAEVRTMTGEVLASAGQANLTDRRFTRRIQIDGTDAGTASISIDERAFERPVDSRTVAAGLLAPVLLALFYAGWPAMHARFTGRLGRSRVASVEIETELTDEVLALGERGLYLLVVNLFNQLALDAADRDARIAHIEAIAEQVAGLYGARLLELPGTGVLLAFEAGSHTDRCFEVICAALLLAQALTDSAMSNDSETATLAGAHRFGLHRGDPPDEAAELIDLEAVSDAVLLSATARNSTLVVSEQVFADLDRAERLLFEDQRNLALGALETTGEHCFLVHGVTDSYQVLIERQAELLNTALAESSAGARE